MKNNFYVAQTNINDCGYASLAMIFNLLGVRYNKDTLKKELVRNKSGTSAYTIIKVANKYGVSAQGYKNYEIKMNDFPLIALEINEEKFQHFVIVLKVTSDKVFLADPRLGMIKIKKEEFLKKYTGIVITFKKAEKLSSILIKNKRFVFIMVILSIIIVFLSISFSYLLSFTLKLIEMGSNKNVIYAFLLFFFIVGVFKECISLFKNRISLKFQLLIDKVITLPLLEKLLSLPHAFYNQNGAGELISKVNDLSHVKDMLYMAVEVLFVNVILIAFSFLITLYLNSFVFMLNFIIFLSFYFINKRFLRRHFYKTYNLQIKSEKLNGNMMDYFNGILTIKNLVKEDYFTNKLKKTYDDVIKEYKNLTIPYQNKEFLISLLIVILNILLIMLLVYSNYSLSKIVFITSLENLIITSFLEVFKLQPMYFNYKSSYLRINEILKEKAIENSKSLINVKTILFKNVFYKYDEKFVLKGITFGIKRGEFVMITGTTGSGKSTLFKLLTKQIKGPYDGIFINGKSLDEYDSIRNTITYVDQKARLFNLPLEENILLGKKDLSKGIKASLVDEFIKFKQINLDYVADSINSNLSGGQIEKVIIAQTLCNCADTVIFDETTSQLDVLSERKILSNIKKYYPNKTVILITHRDKNADLFDLKVEFYDGVIKKIERSRYAKIK